MPNTFGSAEKQNAGPGFSITDLFLRMNETFTSNIFQSYAFYFLRKMSSCESNKNASLFLKRPLLFTFVFFTCKTVSGKNYQRLFTALKNTPSCFHDLDSDFDYYSFVTKVFAKKATKIYAIFFINLYI